MGGSQQTERAVELALEWLARHQAADGHWDGQRFDDHCGECDGQTEVPVNVAVTGLSILCFLGAGHTSAADGPYRETVSNAVTWLVQLQHPDGDLRNDEETMSPPSPCPRRSV
jgi:squalene cyclase